MRPRGGLLVLPFGAAAVPTFIIYTVLRTHGFALVGMTHPWRKDPGPGGGAGTLEILSRWFLQQKRNLKNFFLAGKCIPNFVWSLWRHDLLQGHAWVWVGYLNGILGKW